ncbi:pEARLI lipid transfer protein 1 [Spatholobus suberectus]|nr:pEARLI lipid transfer protein 1 [Spatholobus suberectus]
MASNKLLATILVLSLFSYSTFTEANGCPPSPKPTPPTPKPSPSPPPAPKASCPPPSPPSSKGSCPKDTLKLGVCADLLGLVNIVVGTPPSSQCCALIKGLADLEAVLCLCTAIKANVLGINLNVPVTLSLILSACQKTVPPGFQCP